MDTNGVYIELQVRREEGKEYLLFLFFFTEIKGDNFRLCETRRKNAFSTDTIIDLWPFLL